MDYVLPEMRSIHGHALRHHRILSKYKETRKQAAQTRAYRRKQAEERVVKLSTKAAAHDTPATRAKASSPSRPSRGHATEQVPPKMAEQEGSLVKEPPVKLTPEQEEAQTTLILDEAFNEGFREGYALPSEKSVGDDHDLVMEDSLVPKPQRL